LITGRRFFSVGAAILLSSRENLAVIRDDHLPAILDLRQYDIHIGVAHTSSQDMFFGGIRIGQNRHLGQATFDAVKRLLFNMSLLAVDPFAVSQFNGCTISAKIQKASEPVKS